MASCLRSDSEGSGSLYTQEGRGLQQVRKCVPYYKERGIENDLKNVLRDQKKLVVVGMTGSGSAQVCRYVIDKFAMEGGIEDRETVEVNSGTMARDEVEYLKEHLSQPDHQVKVIFFDNVTQESVTDVSLICNAPYTDGIFVVIATKNCLLQYPKQVTQNIHGMSSSQTESLLENFDVKLSHEEVNKLITKFDGLPLATVSVAKHMTSNKSDFARYWQDFEKGYEKCCFIYGEYENDVGIGKAVKRDLDDMLRELHPKEKELLLSIAYMGGPVPVDILTVRESRLHKEIVISKLLDHLQSRALAKVYRTDKYRILDLHNCVREFLIRDFTDNSAVIIKNALKMVNNVFCKDVREKSNFNLQESLLSISVHMLDNHCSQLGPDKEMKLIMLETYNKMGHMHCQMKDPEKGKNALDLALDCFGEIYMSDNRFTDAPLKDRIAQSLVKSADSAATFSKVCIKQIDHVLCNLPDYQKMVLKRFTEENVCNQFVSDDHFSLYRERLTKREDSLFQDNPRHMSHTRYNCLVGQGMALKLNIMNLIYPFELLAGLMYSRGRLHFYNGDMCPKLAERHFEICKEICEFVSRTYQVNLLHGMLCETNARLYFLIDEKEPDIRKRKKDCMEAQRVYNTFLNSEKKYFEMGLLKHHKDKPAYTHFIFMKQILKARWLVLKCEQNGDGSVLESCKNDLISLETKLNDGGYDLTHKVKILITMGKIWIEIASRENYNTDFEKAKSLSKEVCSLVSKANNSLIQALHTDWWEALEMLRHLFVIGKMSRIENKVKKYIDKCNVAIPDEMVKCKCLDSAKHLLQEIRNDHDDPTSSGFTSIESYE